MRRASEKEIAVEVGYAIAMAWVDGARYHEALRLCGEILAVWDDHRIYHMAACAETVLGDAEAARVHYERALEDAHGDDAESSIRERASILHNLAGLVSQQGEVERALDLWGQSLALHEKIGDVRGKASALHQMAVVSVQQGEVERALDLSGQSLALFEKIGDVRGMAAALQQIAVVIAQQGEVDRALDLWGETLALFEKIGDVRGMAATLSQMAWAAGKTGDAERERSLNMEAARLFGRIHAWVDLATVLANRAAGDAPDSTSLLAQALWLAHAVAVPVDDSVDLTAVLLQRLTPAHPHAPALAVGAQLLVVARGARHPQQQELLRYTGMMLGACVEARAIAEEDVRRWLHEEGLDDPKRLVPKLFEALEALVPEGAWLFDRALVRAKG